MKARALAWLFVLLASGRSLAAPGLDASFMALPSSSLLGEPFSIAMQVKNTDSNPVAGVSPAFLAIQSGFDGLILSGPQPASLSLPAGASGSFTWTFSGSSCGDVYFSGLAHSSDDGGVSSAWVSSTAVVMVCTATPTPIVVYATVTPLPAEGRAVILGNLFHPLQGQPLQMNYLVPFDGEVTVTLYSRDGKKVKQFQFNAPAGPGTLSWDGRSDQGEMVASGIYVAVFRGKGLSKMLKLVVVK